MLLFLVQNVFAQLPTNRIYRDTIQISDEKDCKRAELIKRVFKPFKIELVYGDEVHISTEMNIYEKDGKFYANYYPYKYHNPDSFWTVSLTDNKMENCMKFLATARSIPQKCLDNSSSVELYTISTVKEIIKIDGKCNWDKLDFWGLREILFYEILIENERAERNKLQK